MAPIKGYRGTMHYPLACQTLSLLAWRFFHPLLGLLLRKVRVKVRFWVRVWIRVRVKEGLGIGLGIGLPLKNAFAFRFGESTLPCLALLTTVVGTVVEKGSVESNV
jgi:hypothetical protein